MFHINHGPVSYHFQDRRRFPLKIVKKISHPLVFCAPAEGVPLGIRYQRMGSKTRVMMLPGQERSLTISSGVWIQYTNVTDRLTDCHQSTAMTVLTHSVAQ